MTILNVRTFPDPVLHKVARPVKSVTPEIAKLMDDMADTMYADSGVGLAAPQIGVSKRVIVIDVGIELPSGNKRSNLIKIANPEITSSSGEIEWEEGCLSIPGFRMKVARKARITVKGLDRDDRQIEIFAEGLLAVAFQHEIDHLDGRLLIDRVSKAEQEKYLKMVKKTTIL